MTQKSYWDYMSELVEDDGVVDFNMEFNSNGAPLMKPKDFSINTDMVNHPPHYNKGIETTEYIKSWDMNWCQANIVKYVSRYNLKHDDKRKQLEDLRKAKWYLNDLICTVEKTLVD